MTNFSDKVNFIWSVADLIRGPYRPNQYKDVMLPLTVLRRLDCVLESTKDKVLAKYQEMKGGKGKLMQTRLYIYPDSAAMILYVISIGTKVDQKGDIRECQDYIRPLKRKG